MRKGAGLVAGLIGLSLWAGAALADRAAQMEDLLGAIRIGETVEIMREEGLLYGESLAEDMMPEADLGSWRNHMGRIYDTSKMRRLVAERLSAELEGVDLGPLAGFFTSDLGAEIIALELSAREAFLDREVEEAAKAQVEELESEEARIMGQIEQLIADSDLIDLNVMGILNSNLMLYRGLADGGAYELSEEEMLVDVWSQEEGVREDSTAWITAFLLTAYQPLDPEELDRYIAFWQTEEGRALNRALFATFDSMYEEISYLVGQAVAQHLRSQKL